MNFDELILYDYFYCLISIINPHAFKFDSFKIFLNIIFYLINSNNELIFILLFKINFINNTQLKIHSFSNLSIYSECTRGATHS